MLAGHGNMLAVAAEESAHTLTGRSKDEFDLLDTRPSDLAYQSLT